MATLATGCLSGFYYEYHRVIVDPWLSLFVMLGYWAYVLAMLPHNSTDGKDGTNGNDGTDLSSNQHSAIGNRHSAISVSPCPWAILILYLAGGLSFLAKGPVGPGSSPGRSSSASSGTGNGISSALGCTCPPRWSSWRSARSGRGCFIAAAAGPSWTASSWTAFSRASSRPRPATSKPAITRPSGTTSRTSRPPSCRGCSPCRRFAIGSGASACRGRGTAPRWSSWRGSSRSGCSCSARPGPKRELYLLPLVAPFGAVAGAWFASVVKNEEPSRMDRMTVSLLLILCVLVAFTALLGAIAVEGGRSFSSKPCSSSARAALTRRSGVLSRAMAMLEEV